MLKMSYQLEMHKSLVASLNKQNANKSQVDSKNLKLYYISNLKCVHYLT